MIQQPLPQEQSKIIRAEIDKTYLELVNASRKLKLVGQLGFGWKDGLFHEFYGIFYKFVFLTRFEDATKKALATKYKRGDGSLLIDNIKRFFDLQDAKNDIVLALKLSEEYTEAMFDLGVVSYQ